MWRCFLYLNYYLFNTLLSASEENNDNYHQKTFDGILPDLVDLELKKEKGLDIYGDFIQEAKVRAQKAIQENPTIYSEVHHILPRHSGGADDLNN